MNAAISILIDPENIGHPSDVKPDEDSEPILPPPRNVADRALFLPLSKKRTCDDAYSTSSDPPVFSSDDLPAGLENYSAHRTKRLHQGPWWTTPSSRELRISNGRVRPKREFKRNIDSGVWMNSDDTEIDGASDSLEVSSSEAVGDGNHEEGKTNHDTQEHLTNDGSQASGHNVRHVESSCMNPAQSSAMHDVLQRVEAGCEAFDLSDLALRELPGCILNPLRYLTVQPPHRLPPSQEAYHPLTPSIRLYLSNNFLRNLPGEVYKIENLVELSIRDNKISTILPSLSQLVNLEVINLSGNKFNYLPWEFLDHIRSGKFKRSHLHPNPFFAPVSDQAGCDGLPELPPYVVVGRLILYATTRIAYLDITGRACTNSPPAPSATNCHKPKTGNQPIARTSEWTTRTNHTPSLFELALRTCANSPTSPLPEDSPPAASKWLKHALLVREAGGTLCSVCRKPYVIPRAEWIEWWYGVSSGAAVLPLLRRACSWGCASGLNLEVNERWRRCGWKEDEETLLNWRKIPVIGSASPFGCQRESGLPPSIPRRGDAS